MAEPERKRWSGQIASPSKYASAARARAGESGEAGLHSFLTGRNPRTHHRGRYTLVIAAEYFTCMALVVVSAGLVGKHSEMSPAEQALTDPAVVLVRLSAVSALFFALALLSAGRTTGRLSAAFGGVVTLGIGLNATGGIRELASVFTGKEPKRLEAKS